jgi:2-polyprenyl-6-methoxyphenol hydroxylase-like FAD-dependent oxidoreductase
MTQLSAAVVTDVLVVGAGPTGLVAAAVLARAGTSCIIVDAAAEPTGTSKAAIVHAATLELLDEIDAAEELVTAGVILHRIVVRDQGRFLARIALDGLPSRYPFALGVPQSTTEQVLLRRLAELDVPVSRSRRVESIQTDGDGYLVSGVDHSRSGYAETEAVPFTIRARYVIGADGAHSTVRTAAGVAFPGNTYASQFVLADVGLADADGEAATISLSPQGVTVIARLPTRNHRIVATVDTDNVPAAPDRAFLDALLRDRGLGERLSGEPTWSSRFRVHHRVAAHFRSGGVFLAGDAAHVHSPAAGQGMNTGIADAYELATRLAATVGGADKTVLDAYEPNRRSAALEVLRFTDRMTRVALLKSPSARLTRRVLAGTIGNLGLVQRPIATWISGLRRSPLRKDLPVATFASRTSTRDRLTSESAPARVRATPP